MKFKIGSIICDKYQDHYEFMIRKFHIVCLEESSFCDIQHEEEYYNLITNIFT